MGALTITGQAKGDVLYFDGADWTRLGIGTKDQVLRVNGGGSIPLWDDMATVVDGQSDGQTLRWMGTSWRDSSALVNDGTDISMTGSLTVDESVTLGDGAGDALTINAGTVTLTNHMWTDAQVVDALTTSAAGSVADGALSPNVTLLGATVDLDSSVEVTGILPAASVGSGLTDAQVTNDLTLTNLTQITNRALSDTTGDLDPDRLAGDTVDDDLIDAAVVGSGLTDAQVSDTLTIGASSTVADGALSPNVAHLNAAETISADWVNTANPWADSEVSDTLTIGASSTVADAALSAQVAHLSAAETITADWVNTANPWADAEVADTITLTNITQISSRELADTTGDLDPDRLAGDTVDDDLVDAALVASGLTDAQISDTLTISSAGSVDVGALNTAGEAQGDVLIRDGTGWRRLSAGTSGQLLQTLGAGGNPQWANVSGTIADGTTSGSTMRWDGAFWVESSALANDGTDVSVSGTLTAVTGLLASGSVTLGDAAGDSLTVNAGTVTMPNYDWSDAQVADALTVSAAGSVADGALSAQVAHLNAAETITADWVNTANPWADSEIADALTISGGTVENSVIGATTPAAGSFTDLSATGDISGAGGFRVPYAFADINIAKNLTNEAMDVIGMYAIGNTEYVMPFSGSVLAISLAANGARDGGTATVEIAVNGTGTGLQAQLNATDTQYAFSTQAKDTDAFSAGDRLSVLTTTDSAWGPTTADLVVTVIVEQ
jgi:hypothetical protein